MVRALPKLQNDKVLTWMNAVWVSKSTFCSMIFPFFFSREMTSFKMCFIRCIAQNKSDQWFKRQGNDHSIYGMDI